MDDFIHRLKEKNSNLINILNNHHHSSHSSSSNHQANHSQIEANNNHNNHNDLSFPNLNLSKIGKQNQQKENEIANTTTSNTATLIYNGLGSGNYIKAILNKHKASHLAKNASANESASSLAFAALNLTNTAKFTTNMHAYNKNANAKTVALPNISSDQNANAGAIQPVTTNNNNNNNNNNTNGGTVGAQIHKSIMPKYSSSTLFKLNNLKSHFQFNKNF
jgi:hypothetical protein